MATHPLLPGPIPLYHQLKQIVRSEIERGIYKPGDRLPAEPELIQKYGVSRITVRQALTELENEGTVVRRHGKGTYVAERRIEQDLVRLTDFVEDMHLAGLVPSSQVLAFVHEAANPQVAAALNLSTDEEVIRVDRLRLANDLPIAYDTTWLPLRFGMLLSQEMLTHETIYHILETRYSIPVEAGIFHITAAMATVEQARMLDIASGTALLLIQRISCTASELPVYIQERYYRTDRVSYRVTLHRHGDAIGGMTAIRELRPIFREQSSLDGKT
ncbi:MAG: GntR family transcriptional regulator [Ktedonobacteraceae bacterium]